MAARVNGIFTSFVILTDPRVEQIRRHELNEGVVVAKCATIANSDILLTLNDSASGDSKGDAHFHGWRTAFLRMTESVVSFRDLTPRKLQFASSSG